MEKYGKKAAQQFDRVTRRKQIADQAVELLVNDSGENRRPARHGAHPSGCCAVLRGGRSGGVFDHRCCLGPLKSAESADA
jgi:hypothetical protein